MSSAPVARAADVLTEPILARLEAAGVHSFEDWCRLGPSRLKIFGITRAMARRIDALARSKPFCTRNPHPVFRAIRRSYPQLTGASTCLKSQK